MVTKPPTSWILIVVLTLVTMTMLVCGGSMVQAADDSRTPKDEREQKRLRNLKAIPYIDAIPLSENESIPVGVTVHDRSRACPGLNMFSPRDEKNAYLVDMDGAIVHRWRVDSDARDGLHHIELDDEGALLTIIKDIGMFRVSWQSEVEWVSRQRFHHDIAVGPEGTIYAPCRRERLVQRGDRQIPILDDSLCVLSPGGHVEKRLSLFDLFGERIPDGRMDTIERWIRRQQREGRLPKNGGIEDLELRADCPADVFHLNSVQLIERTIPDVCSKGDLLVSIRELDLIAFVDPRMGDVRWTWGPGELEGQHHPTLLDNGHILVFDNGRRRGFSRVLEVDPRSREIVWLYRDEPMVDFFSKSRGGCQRLPNGNTLITESDRGRIFEVTLVGELVWKFLAPVRTHRARDGVKKQRVPVYRMMRITDSEAAALPLAPLDPAEAPDSGS